MPYSVPALTVRQPFASLLMSGLKDVENRTWRTNYRGPLAIHAAAAYDTTALNDLAWTLDLLPDPLPRSVVLGTIELLDCVRDADSEWAEPDQWHWILANPRRLSTPIPARGRLGLWKWSPEIALQRPHSPQEVTRLAL